MNTGLRMIGLLVTATAVAVAEMRTWTFEESGKTVQGEVLGFAGTAVTLKGADGKTFSVPIAYLTESNRTYLAAERAKQWKEVEVFKLEGEESGGRYKKCTVHGQGVNGRNPDSTPPVGGRGHLERPEPAGGPNCRVVSADQEREPGRAAGKGQHSRPAASGYGPYRQAVRVERAEVDMAD